MMDGSVSNGNDASDVILEELTQLDACLKVGFFFLSLAFIWLRRFTLKGKGKGTLTHVERRGPELIPDSRQSACR